MLRRAQYEQRSLFGEILDWMLAPLLLLWPMSLGLTWLVAQSIANRPYDREMAEMVQALANQTGVQLSTPLAEGPHPAVTRRRELERVAANFMRDDEEGDRTAFQVLGPRGELVAGDPRLAVPPEEPSAPRGVRFRDDTLADEPLASGMRR
jgi:two-component system, OmpR family, sensor histidine kinase TctE